MKKNFLTRILPLALIPVLLCGCGTNTPASTETNTETSEAVSVEVETESECQDADEKTVASDSPDVISNISYIDDDATYHMLDLYGTQSVSEKMPTVIEVHGGGFIGGSKENNAEHCTFFVENGYTVVAPDYSKIPRNGDFVTAIQDLFTVYQWVYDNADTYHFDTNNIFLSGDSAGGYYVLLTCAIWHSEDLQDYFGVTPPKYDFSTYVTTCPAADIMALQDQFKEESGPNAHVAQTIGEDLVFNEDLMAHLDLMSNVDASAFEGIYMLTTPNDTTTGANVIAFDQYLTDKNVEHATISYEGQENDLGHTFNISHPDYVESTVANQDMVNYINKFLK